MLVELSYMFGEYSILGLSEYFVKNSRLSCAEVRRNANANQYMGGEKEDNSDEKLFVGCRSKCFLNQD